MSRNVLLTLIALGWSLAAVTLWKSGAWVERIHRFDDCTYVGVGLGEGPVWVCPAGRRSPAVPERDEPGATA